MCRSSQKRGHSSAKDVFLKKSYKIMIKIKPEAFLNRLYIRKERKADEKQAK